MIYTFFYYTRESLKNHKYSSLLLLIYTIVLVSLSVHGGTKTYVVLLTRSNQVGLDFGHFVISKSSRTFTRRSHWAAGSRFKAKLSACQCTWACLNCEPYRIPSVWHVGECCCCGWEFTFCHDSSRLKYCCRRESNRRGRTWHCVK